MKDMKELFLHYLQDIYYAERQGLKAYPKLVKATKNEGPIACAEAIRPASRIGLGSSASSETVNQAAKAA